MSAGWHPMGQLCAPGLAQPRLSQCASQGRRALHRPLPQLLDWQGLRLRVRLSLPFCILDAFQYVLVHLSHISEAGMGVLQTEGVCKASSGEAARPGAVMAGSETMHACSGMTARSYIDNE